MPELDRPGDGSDYIGVTRLRACQPIEVAKTGVHWSPPPCYSVRQQEYVHRQREIGGVLICPG